MEWIIIGWIVCGVASYGILVHHFQTKFPSIARESWWSDRIFAATMAVGGPVSLLVSLFCAGLLLRGENTFGWRL